MTKLRGARLARGWSQDQLIDRIVDVAALLGEQVAARPSLKVLLSRWENGHAVPDARYRRVLVEVFGGEDPLGFPGEHRATGEERPTRDQDRDNDADTVLVPVAMDGGLHYVSIRRRDLLAAGIGTALGLALGDAKPVREQEDRIRSFSSVIARKMGSARVTVIDPGLKELILQLPDGDSVSGATLPITLGSAGNRIQDQILIELGREEADRISRADQPSRLYVTSRLDSADSFFALGGRAAARQLRSDRSSLKVPSAYLLDDVALGILWGAASFDQPLLDDDSLLARRQANPIYRGAAIAPEVADDLTSDLSPASRMWMGSEYCARYIVRNFDTLSHTPRFWTREQRGREACTWLFFGHKLRYLQEAYERNRSNTHSTMTRSFCIPEDAVRSSPAWERVLLLLSVALMESLGIEVHVCTEPDLSDVDGIVIAPDSRALVANWVRASNAWVTGATTSKSLLSSYRDKIDFSIQASVNVGENPRQRLQSLCAYLGLGWHQLGVRCQQLSSYSPRGIYEPRSRLLSLAGVDRALGFVESLHRSCSCQRRLASA